MISSCDAQTGCKVIENGKDCGLEQEWRPQGLYAAIERNANDQGDIEPINVFVPICFGHGRFCDVWLLGVIFRVPVGL